jgi:3-methylcrotonyl-CoA carboxylase beta subunit
MIALTRAQIIVREQGSIFLAGPPLVKAATGEETTDEELGGGAMHSRVSGVTDHLAVSDEHALVLARQAVAHFGAGVRRTTVAEPDAPPEEPLYDLRELRGVVPASTRQPFDMRAAIARLVDGSRFHEFKAQYGTTLTTGFAHIHGYECGIVANAGSIIHSAAALKGAHFISLCEQRGLPIVFLVNVSGFMVGTAAERGGIARDGAKMVRAVAACTVPKLTVVCSGSFGAGNYAMAGRACACAVLMDPSRS